MKTKKAFTLMELLIVIAIIALIAVVALVLFNPMKQIRKSYDARRKHDLAEFQKAMEDYYNDKNCYPQPQEVCYDYNPAAPLKCHICGNESTSPSFAPYLPTLPCDPRQPMKKYLYQVDNESCPSLFRIYTLLAYTSDPATQEYCSADGSGETDYNWGSSSPNTVPLINCVTITSTPIPTPTSVTPTPTPTLTPAPGDYYCQNYQNCSSFDKNIWDCSPTFLDPLCTGSDGCTTQIGSCTKK